MLGLAFATSGEGYDEITVPEGYTPAWHDGGVYANAADGNPVYAVMHRTAQMIWAGDLYFTEVLVLREFTLPRNISAKNFRIYTNTSSVGLWKHFIYRKSDRALLWNSGLVGTIAQGWNAYPMNDLPMLGNTQYWYGVVSVDPNIEAGFLTAKSFAIAAKFYGNYGKAPIGNLNIGLPVVITAYLPTEQYGTIPAVLPADDGSTGQMFGITVDLPVGFICEF